MPYFCISMQSMSYRPQINFQSRPRIVTWKPWYIKEMMKGWKTSETWVCNLKSGWNALGLQCGPKENIEESLSWLEISFQRISFNSLLYYLAMLTGELRERPLRRKGPCVRCAWGGNCNTAHTMWREMGKRVWSCAPRSWVIPILAWNVKSNPQTETLWEIVQKCKGSGFFRELITQKSVWFQSTEEKRYLADKIAPSTGDDWLDYWEQRKLCWQQSFLSCVSDS